MKTTPAQKKNIDLLKENKGAFLRPHVKVTGTRCFRIVSEDFSPLGNEGLIIRRPNNTLVLA